jgi:hypothetical protein
MDGGTAVKLADVGPTAGLSWGADWIVLGAATPGGLRKVPSNGGTASPLTEADRARGERFHRWPVVLADGETVLYAAIGAGGLRNERIGVVSLASGTHATLGVQGTSPLGVVSGLLVYHDALGSLLGIPFDLRSRGVTGGMVPLVDAVAFGGVLGAARAALSHEGSLIYLSGGRDLRERELVMVGMDGTERPVTDIRRPFLHPRYSPDGKRISVTVEGDSISEIWIYDRVSATLSLLTRGLHSTRAQWHPDGRTLIYSSSRAGGRFGLWQQPADGSAPAALLQPADASGQPVEGMITPGGRFLVYRTGYRRTTDILSVRALSGDTTSKPLAADTTFVQRNVSISPDGKWAAYASNESGDYQMYVRPLPGPGPRYLVSVNGGNAGVWSPDGRKLYYQNGARMEEATITTSPSFSVTRRVLFERNYVTDLWFRSFDLAQDGKSFLFVRNVGVSAAPATIVVHSWAAEVRARTAAGTAK